MLNGLLRQLARRAKPARVAGTSLARIAGRRSELCRSSSTSGTSRLPAVSRIDRNGTAEPVSALDNVLYADPCPEALFGAVALAVGLVRRVYGRRYTSAN